MTEVSELWQVPAADPVPADQVPADPAGELLANWVAELIYQSSITTARSLSRKVGPSGLGNACSKAVAYGAHGVPRLNFGTDPWAAIVGTAVHEWMAELFRTLDTGAGRYLVETKTSYRDVSGTADLYDRRTATVIDWKTTRKSKIRTIQKTAPPPNHVTQIHTYGAGLEAGGESPERVALVFLPVDGTLNDVHAWVAPYDRSIADAAIDRYEGLRAAPLEAAAPSPSRLCEWCNWYRPRGGEGCSGNFKGVL
ncbi:PD-(D/E)XK nuclease family protein [Actinomadura litoris]|uniref:PD-(D/E)XK nuclease family protein n=1 Tax=Actinomadura litoris TaxID=2678616 RepID=UPI001FA6C005|nr:PD-(D/E)XK nuclease family protein [Actinomadura litoris]